MHSIELEGMHENWIRSMHENVNEYADDLNKLFFKQTVSQDLSISKSAHTHFCFKHPLLLVLNKGMGPIRSLKREVGGGDRPLPEISPKHQLFRNTLFLE